MTQNIHVFSSIYEDGIAIETEEGRLEAVVIHLPGSEPTLHVASMTPEQMAEGDYTELYSCPVSAA